MPFDQLIPRPFLQLAVQNYAPAAPGVYGISNSREWIYIGETENIRGALLSHLIDPQASLMRREPTGFVFEICDTSHRSGRQDRLILEYEPFCNRQAPRRLGR